MPLFPAKVNMYFPTNQDNSRMEKKWEILNLLLAYLFLFYITFNVIFSSILAFWELEKLKTMVINNSTLYLI